MSQRAGIALWFLVDALSVGLLGGIGHIVSYGWGILFGSCIYVGIRLANDLIINSKQDYVLVERLGKYYRIYHDGPKLLLWRGLIDRIPANGRGTLAFVQLPIYKGDTGAQFDFRDGSAPVTASVWWCVGDPSVKAGFSGDWTQLDDAIEAHVYAFEDSRMRLEEIIDGFVRPILQGLTIDDASTERGAGSTMLSQKMMADPTVQAALRELGAWLDPTRAFVLSDVDIPTSLSEARQRRLVATANADADIQTGRGIRGALNKIRGPKPKDGDPDTRMGDHEAARIFGERNAQNVLTETKPDISLVGSDVGGLARTLQITDASNQRGRRNRNTN